jgi:hypothetical protein
MKEGYFKLLRDARTAYTSGSPEAMMAALAKAAEYRQPAAELIKDFKEILEEFTSPYHDQTLIPW